MVETAKLFDKTLKDTRSGKLNYDRIDPPMAEAL